MDDKYAIACRQQEVLLVTEYVKLMKIQTLHAQKGPCVPRYGAPEAMDAPETTPALARKVRP